MASAEAASVAALRSAFRLIVIALANGSLIAAFDRSGDLGGVVNRGA